MNDENMNKSNEIMEEVSETEGKLQEVTIEKEVSGPSKGFIALVLAAATATAVVVMKKHKKKKAAKAKEADEEFEDDVIDVNPEDADIIIDDRSENGQESKKK